MNDSKVRPIRRIPLPTLPHDVIPIIINFVRHMYVHVTCHCSQQKEVVTFTLDGSLTTFFPNYFFWKCSASALSRYYCMSIIAIIRSNHKNAHCIRPAVS